MDEETVRCGDAVRAFEWVPVPKLADDGNDTHTLENFKGRFGYSGGSLYHSIYQGRMVDWDAFKASDSKYTSKATLISCHGTIYASRTMSFVRNTTHSFTTSY